MQMQQQTVDSVVQEVYNYLSFTWINNKKSKLHYFGYQKSYAEKSNTIIKCIKLIKENEIKNIKYMLKVDEKNDNYFIVTFRFKKCDFPYTSFSFHLPNVYKNLVKEVM